MRTIPPPHHGGNHRPDWKLTITGLEDQLEITNAHSAGHTVSIALNYLRRTGRDGFTAASVTLIEKLPTDLKRHTGRPAEAEQTGRVLPPSTGQTPDMSLPRTESGPLGVSGEQAA